MSHHVAHIPIAALVFSLPIILAFILTPKPKTRYEKNTYWERVFRATCALYVCLMYAIAGTCIIGLMFMGWWKAILFLAVYGAYFYFISLKED
jgi:hypothetical protein